MILSVPFCPRTNFCGGDFNIFLYKFSMFFPFKSTFFSSSSFTRFGLSALLQFEIFLKVPFLVHSSILVGVAFALNAVMWHHISKLDSMGYVTFGRGSFLWSAGGSGINENII